MQPARPKRLPGIFVVLAFMAVAGPTRSSAMEVHDIVTVSPPGQEVIKCGCLTCGNPCNVQPPPMPCPPPPPMPCPPPPPEDPSLLCPPPPSQMFDFWGPPADLYHVDPWYLSAANQGWAPVGLPALLGFVLWGLLGTWWL